MTHLRIKKMLALVIVAALSFGVVGCGGNGANVTAPEVTTEVATTEEMDAESLKLKRQIEEIIEDTNMSQTITEYVDAIKENIDNNRIYEDKEDLKSLFGDYRNKAKSVYDTFTENIVDTYKNLAEDNSITNKDSCLKVTYEAFAGWMTDVYDSYNQGLDDIYDYCDSLITDSEVSTYCQKKYADTQERMEKDYQKISTRLSDDYTLVSAGFAEGNYDVYDILGKTSESSASEDDTDTTTEAKKKSTKKSKKSKKKKKTNGVDPDLKKALDEYESFMDEYCEFMKKYNSSNDVMSMLNDYTKMLTKYTEMTDKINAIDTDSLSTEDYKYYIEVTSRVSKKLIDAGASM